MLLRRCWRPRRVGRDRQARVAPGPASRGRRPGPRRPTARGNRSHSTRLTDLRELARLHAATASCCTAAASVARERAPGGERRASPRARARACRGPAQPHLGLQLRQALRAALCVRARLGGRTLLLAGGDRRQAEHDSGGERHDERGGDELCGAPAAGRQLAIEEARELDDARERFVTIAASVLRHPLGRYQ